MFGLIGILLFLASFAANGQVKIWGKLTDTKNKPLLGASITIINSYGGGATYSLGKYSFTTSEKGDHILEIPFQDTTHIINI